jgi:hypothetical protein
MLSATQNRRQAKVSFSPVIADVALIITPPPPDHSCSSRQKNEQIYHFSPSLMEKRPFKGFLYPNNKKEGIFQ